MATNIKFPKHTGWGLLTIGLAIVCITICLTRSPFRAAPDPNDILRETVAQGMDDNVSKLSCAILVWNSERKFFGPWSDKPQTAGNHQLWWNNNSIAILSKTNTAIRDPNGQAPSNQETTFMTYDGKTFQVAEMPGGSTGKVEILITKKPTNRFYDNNYLQRVGWLGISPLNNVSKGDEPGVEKWLTEENKAIKRTFHNTRTGQIGISTYDIEKAYGLVAKESYVKEDVLQSRTTVRYQQVSGGAWFPVSVIIEGHNIQNGELLYRNKIKLDVSKSVFNDPSAVPEKVFELEIGPNSEVTDLTSLKTRLKMRLKSANRGQPLSSKYFVAFRPATQYSAGHGSSLAY